MTLDYIIPWTFTKRGEMSGEGEFPESGRPVITPPRIRGGAMFLLEFVCVCLSVSSCVSVGEQNSSRTDEPIWTRFSLKGCLLRWLKPY